MTVARILAHKGHAVTSAQPHVSLREIVDMLADKHIGALVISDVQGSMLGIISERDVVRALARRGVDALDEPVSRFMTKNVITAHEEESLVEVARKMTVGRFRHMPVMSDGRLIGIVSVGDAIKYRLEQMEAEQSALREYIATA